MKKKRKTRKFETSDPLCSKDMYVIWSKVNNNREEGNVFLNCSRAKLKKEEK